MQFGFGAQELLVSALASCGPTSPFFPVARKLAAGESLSETETKALLALLGISRPEVSVQDILRKFASISHFEDMQAQARQGCPTVAEEIPIEFRSFLHTFLPVKNGVYENEGRIVRLEGLVPLGPQKGQLIAHLGAVFSARCPAYFLESLKRQQAENIEFLKAADRVGVYDYRGTKLRALTEIGKEQLGL